MRLKTDAKVRKVLELSRDCPYLFIYVKANGGRNDERSKRKAMFTSALPCKEEEGQRPRCVVLSCLFSLHALMSSSNRLKFKKLSHEYKAFSLFSFSFYWVDALMLNHHVVACLVVNSVNFDNFERSDNFRKMVLQESVWVNTAPHPYPLSPRPGLRPPRPLKEVGNRGERLPPSLAEGTP